MADTDVPHNAAPAPTAGYFKDGKYHAVALPIPAAPPPRSIPPLSSVSPLEYIEIFTENRRERGE